MQIGFCRSTDVFRLDSAVLILIIVFKMNSETTREARETPCRRQTLSQHGPFTVEACGCGMVHLTFGFLTLRIAPSALDALCATLLEAAAQVERPRAPAH
jgi:hypothetical protein